MTANRRAGHPTATARRLRAPWALGLAVALAAAGCGGSSPNRAAPGGPPSTSALPPATTGPATTASTTTPVPAAVLESALTGAYQAETRALATYQQVVASLGPVGPFPNVTTAEKAHVAAVTALFSHYGIGLPGAAGAVPSPATLSAACALGVSLEQQVIAFYADQMPRVSAYRDVTTTFGNLQAASRDSHLPAFQHCS